MTKNLIPTINISSIINQDFSSKKSIKILTKYFDEIFILGEILFKSIIKLYNKDINNSKLAFSRLKTLSTLRFNYYPNQKKPVEISNRIKSKLWVRPR